MLIEINIFDQIKNILIKLVIFTNDLMDQFD